MEFKRTTDPFITLKKKQKNLTFITLNYKYLVPMHFLKVQL